MNEFVERGCSVLLTDTDVAYLRNPFPFLFRDSDVESMSDGWDAGSAFGFLETVDDASLGREKNSGRRRARRSASPRSTRACGWSWPRAPQRRS